MGKKVSALFSPLGRWTGNNFLFKGGLTWIDKGSQGGALCLGTCIANHGNYNNGTGISYIQCSKLTVHSAPNAHISEAGRTFFGRVRPMCAHFFTQLSLQYTRGVHRKIPGRTVSICVHPRGAQNKTLISNTDII